MNYRIKYLIYLKQVYTSLSKQIKIQISEIFTIFEKNHRLFINNLKSGETKSQIKVYLSYLVRNSYLRNYKTFPHILHQHRVFGNLIINKDIVTMKPNKRNEVVILDRKLYDNAIQKINLDPYKFEKVKKRSNLET